MSFVGNVLFFSELAVAEWYSKNPPIFKSEPKAEGQEMTDEAAAGTVPDPLLLVFSFSAEEGPEPQPAMTACGNFRKRTRHDCSYNTIVESVGGAVFHLAYFLLF